MVTKYVGSYANSTIGLKHETRNLQVLLSPCCGGDARITVFLFFFYLQTNGLPKLLAFKEFNFTIKSKHTTLSWNMT